MSSRRMATGPGSERMVLAGGGLNGAGPVLLDPEPELQARVAGARSRGNRARAAER